MTKRLPGKCLIGLAALVLASSAPLAQERLVLNVGKTIYLYHKGADGVVDISPFTCLLQRLEGFHRPTLPYQLGA